MKIYNCSFQALYGIIIILGTKGFSATTQKESLQKTAKAKETQKSFNVLTVSEKSQRTAKNEQEI